MAARIPHLTLFSGFRCSECEIAKVELAKVKEQHSKLIESAQREFDLEVINIQERDCARWQEKHIHWIPALHLDGKEIAMGRWDASTVLEALKQWEALKQLEVKLVSERSTE
ncbi:hypothetical protein J3R83DRAFT_4795 [Lanmaoa asiatica]|nr:hypothetical protein J3R83DRAFT_4795 [Lanmaoa asiatica]